MIQDSRTGKVHKLPDRYPIGYSDMIDAQIGEVVRFAQFRMPEKSANG